MYVPGLVRHEIRLANAFMQRPPMHVSVEPLLGDRLMIQYRGSLSCSIGTLVRSAFIPRVSFLLLLPSSFLGSEKNSTRYHVPFFLDYGVLSSSYLFRLYFDVTVFLQSPVGPLLLLYLGGCTYSVVPMVCFFHRTSRFDPCRVAPNSPCSLFYSSSSPSPQVVPRFPLRCGCGAPVPSRRRCCLVS